MKTGSWLLAGIGVCTLAVVLWWGMQAPPPGESDRSRATVPPEQPAKARKDAATIAPPAQEIGESAAPAQDDGAPVTIDDVTTMQALFMALAGRLEAPMRAWAETRGMPREDPSGNFMLDQPYRQYDDETLLALARNGDMWAQQILADRISGERPAEAMELYRQAAASGSVYAMLVLADLSERIAGMSPDFKFEDEGVALEQYYSLRDALVSPDVTAYAWNAVAEMAGLPGYMAMTGVGRLPEDQIEAGCQLASSIYTDLLEQRAANGLGGYPSDPPPVWIDANALGGGGTCQHDRAVSYDFSACQQYVVNNPESEEQASFYVCDDS